MQYNNIAQSVELKNPADTLMDQRYMRQMISSSYFPGYTYPWMKNPIWKDIEIGSSGNKIGDEGSLLCAISCIYPREDAGVTTPGEVNARLMDADAYEGNGNLDWEKAGAALPKMRYAAYTKFEPSLAADAMREGKSVLAEVRRSDNAAHWLVIFSASPEGYHAMDPQIGEIVSLSQYGRVYTLIIASYVE